MYVPQCFRSNRYGQYLCTCSVTLLCASVNMQISWPSPTIPLLTSPESPIGIQLTTEDVSWVVSIKSIGMLPGAIMVGFVMNNIGPKKTLLVSAVILLLSWIMVTFSRSLPMLLAARAFLGFGGSFIAGMSWMYIGEISEKNIRGRLLTIVSLGSAISGIVIYGVGPFVSFTTLALICAATPALFCILFCFMSESPYYLIKINQREAAYKVLENLSKSSNNEMWLKEIEDTVKNDLTSKVTIKTLFFQTNYRKALIIISVLKLCLQFGGLYAINAYLQTILNASHTSLSPETSSVIFAVVQIPCVLLSAYLVDSVGRRPLLIVSSAGAAIALIGEGIYFYLLEKQNMNLDCVYFLPSFFLLIYYVMMSVGLANLVHVLHGELFTTNVKKVGSSVFAFYTGLFSFITVKMLNPISDVYGIFAIFWIFAGVCFLSVIFGLYVLPETKGKSFDSIQDVLSGNREKEVCVATVLTTKL